MLDIVIHVCTDCGWRTFRGQATDADIAACYALPRHESRARFWGRRLGENIPEGRAMIWTHAGVVEQQDTAALNPAGASRAG
jgi:hypothetical protein